MQFEWDKKKAALNFIKHGVSFDEAVTAFLDPQGRDGEDIDHSFTEPRRLLLAETIDRKVVVVAYTVRRRGNEEATRIISARRASRKERKAYAAETD
jgi:uncharacterized DUF497 family protein